MNIGDTIKCNDTDDMIETMSKLLKDGIESEFLYEKDGIKGLWLEIVAVALRKADI